MVIDERAPSFPPTLISLATALVLTGTLVLAGCDSTDANEEPQIEELIISPGSVTIDVGEQVDFSAAARTASGDTIRDLELRWWSSDSDVFTVADNGTATGRNPGSASCKVELTEDATTTAGLHKTAKRLFTGRDSAFVRVLGN